MANRALIDAGACRVFWFALPPLREPDRIAAARTILRARLAFAANDRFALSTSTGPNGLWCAAVMSTPQMWGPESVPIAACAPWIPRTITWVRTTEPAMLVTPRGESVVIEGDITDDQLPEAITRLSHPDVQRLIIIGPLSDALRTQWQAQLGFQVIGCPQLNAVDSIAFGTPQPLTAAINASGRSTTGIIAAWIALVAAAGHLLLSAFEYQSARKEQHRVMQEMIQLTTPFQQSPDRWRAWLSGVAPEHARDSVAGLLAATIPALATTAHQIKTINVEPRALSVEWNSLVEPDRIAFEHHVTRSGASVVASGTRARVVWP